MEFGEKGFDGSSYKFLEESENKEKEKKKGNVSEENLKLDIIETCQETDFEIEITEEDIKGIEAQMERERNRKGLGGGQKIAFEGAALERLRKEAPEARIEKVELTDEDVKKCKDRMAADISNAAEAKTKEGEKKGWDEEKIKEEIKSEQSWIEEFQTSYLKDILDEKRFKEKGLEVSEIKWNGMVKDLKNLIRKKDWHKVIPRAGHMNNLDPEKFGDVSRSLFDSDDKEGMLQEIEIMRKGEEGTGRKANPWELASRIRYVSECFPDLKSKIEISGKDWEIMARYLKEAREKEWGVKDFNDFGEKGDYWKVAYLECNMKIVENMVKRGEIKVSKEKEEEKDSARE
ncbi:hypothetical protein KKB43_02390 [Patescibacteria group bacterium]|nr:hypothetical protein [Patescibacteria group bacterium]MBU4579841.1 hypothetical protein [Patescibacteria group bacterium]